MRISTVARLEKPLEKQGFHHVRVTLNFCPISERKSLMKSKENHQYYPTLTCKFRPLESMLGPKIEMHELFLIDCFNQSKAILEDAISRHCLDSDESGQNNPSDYRFLNQLFSPTVCVNFKNCASFKSLGETSNQSH